MSASTPGGDRPPDVGESSQKITINQSQQPPKMNYAKVSQSLNFPKRDQAIVLQAVNGFTVKDYVSEIIKITDKENIRFVSRISNGRVCIYLPSKKIADELVEQRQKIKIGDTEINISPLKLPSKRIIISNVYPEIPHYLIEKELNERQIRMESNISFIRAGMPDLGIQHAFSFRRQVYINQEDVDKIPKSIPITFEDMQYWIILSTDGLSCFICKGVGHLAKHCPTNSQQNSIIPEIPSLVNHSTDEENSEDEMLTGDVLPNNNTSINADDYSKTGFPSLKAPNTTYKRPHSLSSTSNSTETHNITEYNSDTDSSIVSLTQMDEEEKDRNLNLTKKTDSFKIPKPRLRKKIKNTKSDKTTDFSSELSCLKEIIEQNQDRYGLNYPSFTELLNNNPVKSIDAETIKQLPVQPNALTAMMRELYPLLENRHTKSKFTKLLKKIETEVANSSTTTKLTPTL